MRRSLGLALIALSPLVLLARLAPTSFVSDDWLLLHDVATGGPAALWTHDTIFLRPLTSLSLWLELRAFGLHPLGFHVVSLALFGLGAIAVGLLAASWRAKTDADEARRTGWIAVFLFAALPTHVEPVGWISAQGDLLAAVLSIFALVACLRAGARARVASFVLWLAASWSKESALGIPFVAVVLLSSHGLPPREVAKRAAPLFVALALYLVLRRALLGRFVAGYGAEVHLAFDRHALANLVLYPLRAVLPPVLAARDRAPLFLTLGTVTFVALALARGLGRRARLAETAVLAACFVLACVPVLTLSVSLVSLEAERLLHLPSVFVALALARLATAFGPSMLPWTALGVLQTWGLFASLDAWVSASRVADATLSALVSSRDARVLFVGLPDSYRGAPIFRNGLDQALATSTSTPVVVVPLGFAVLREPGDGLVLNPSLSGWDVRADGAATIVSFDDPPREDFVDDDVEVHGFREKRLSFTSRDPSVRVAWWTGDGVAFAP